MITNDFYRGFFFFSNYLMLHNRVIYTTMIYMLFVTFMKRNRIFFITLPPGKTYMFANYTRTFKFLCSQLFHVPEHVCIFFFFYLFCFIFLAFFSIFIRYIYQTFFSLKQYSLTRYILNPFTHFYCTYVIFNFNYVYLSIYLNYYDLIVVLF